MLKIGITDSGIGISTEALGKIFDPFVQADASTTRQYGGTGLGLAICAKLTELMGGRIYVESSEGVGSTFFLQIPFSVNDSFIEQFDRRISAKTSTLWDGPSLRILLVDDQEINLLFSTRILQKTGHSVEVARNGQEALRRMAGGGFDLILMDIQMPVMNGIEATQAIREREKDMEGRVPIIALTARAMQEEREEILNNGFDGYVTKPIEIGALMCEMKRCLKLSPA